MNDLMQRARSAAHNLRNCSMRFNVRATQDSAHAAAMLDTCADEIARLSIESQTLRASLPKSDPAPALTHRTVCIIAIATSMHRTAAQLDQLHIELAARFGNTSDIDAKIAAAEDQIKTWKVAIAWLDRVPGVY